MSHTSEQQAQTTDVLIVGGGPAGATAALYAARAGRSTRVIDKGVGAGALGMTKAIANFPGMGGTRAGTEVVEAIRDQAASFGAQFLQDRITVADVTGETKSVFGAQGVYRARTLIVATGSMGRSATIAGEEALVGRGVSYCATCDGFFFGDQDVAVIGNTDEAAEEALYLARFARHVTLLSPTASLRVSEEFAGLLESETKLDVRPATRVREILGSERVEGIRIESRDAGAEVLPVTGVFVYLQGGAPIVDFLNGQVPLTESGCLIVDEMFQTEIAGVFAAGDVLCKHLKQAVIAAAEGASAAVSADRYLAGRSSLKPDWS